MKNANFQDGLNDVVHAFAQGLADECREEPGMDAEELECGLAAALINAAALIMVRRGSSLPEVLELVRDHAAVLGHDPTARPERVH